MLSILFAHRNTIISYGSKFNTLVQLNSKPFDITYKQKQIQNVGFYSRPQCYSPLEWGGRNCNLQIATYQQGVKTEEA